MRVKELKLQLIYAGAIGVGLLLLFIFIANVWIGHEAKNLCQNAKWQYGGDCVTALMAQLDDEHQGFRARNHAIWALGELGDSRALPLLEKYYTGVIPDREPLDETISQYELEKALKLARGGFNMTAWAWRWGVE